MNRHQTQWLNDLRSGEFNQTEGCFKAVDAETDLCVGYCCLGVYLEGSRDEVQWTPFNMVHEGDRDIQQYGAACLSEDEGLDSLPHADLLLLGITTVDTIAAAVFNDSLSWDFNAIADVFEHAFRDGSIDVITAAQELGYLPDDLGELTDGWSLRAQEEIADGTVFHG
jgi:hypothetical protein